MRSRKCPDCSSFWPLHADYQKCPTCRVLTQPSVHVPMDREKAKRLKNVSRFDRFYERREARKKLEGLPSPEQVAHMEVRELKDLDRRAVA